MERLQSQAIEASEQCRRQDVPLVCKEKKLEQVLLNWDENRKIIYLDESLKSASAKLQMVKCAQKAAILVGPEGGFSEKELEFLKSLVSSGFANPVPFIVVDNSEDLEIAFRLLKLRHKDCADGKEAYAHARQLAYELPYFIKKKTSSEIHVEDIIDQMNEIEQNGTTEAKTALKNEIELAYLEKEIERMYDRLAKTGRDTAVVSEKLTKLKKRKTQAK